MLTISRAPAGLAPPATSPRAVASAYRLATHLGHHPAKRAKTIPMAYSSWVRFGRSRVMQKEHTNVTTPASSRIRGPRWRWLAAAASLAAAVVLAASVATAAARPAPVLVLSSSSGAAGTTVSATGTNFAPIAAGSVRVGTTTVATFRTDRKGGFTRTFTIPSAASPGATTVVATTGTLSASRPFTVTATRTTTASTALLGVSTPSGARNLTEVDAFEQEAGKRAGIVMYFQGWAYDEFDPALAAAIAARGSRPEITWEPWDYRAGLNQPAYALGRIIDGSHDAYITRWAQGAKAFGGPLLVRFGHEMNDRNYPWSEQTNGNQPGQYVAAWRHVVDVFRSVGATNVSWIWSPNVSYAGTTPLAQLYPGDSYVDWVALDGYNGGTALPWGGWQTFSQIFGATLNEVQSITTAKPVMIGETASVEQGGSKAAWITDFFSQLASRPQIKAFVWFNHNKEADWRIGSSDSARAAFAAGAAALAS